MGFEIKLHPDAVKLLLNLDPDAVKLLLNLDPDTKERIKTGIESLETSPFRSQSRSGIKKLKGTKKREDLYRLRVGDYRVIYAVDDATVFVLEIIPREKGYDWL